MLSAFQAENPHVQIDTLFVAYDQLPQAYVDAVYAEAGPDLILAPTWWLNQLADAEALVPLDDLMDAEILAGYWPAALQNLRYQGQLWGLPTNFDVVSLYYNRNLIDEAALPTTTDEMLALAQADPTQGAGLYANFYHLFWGIPAYGGSLFDEDGRVILEQTTGTAEFLSWLSTMEQTPGVFVEQDYGELLDRFKKGEFAFFVDGPWSRDDLRQSLGDALAVALLPAGPAGPARPWLSAEGVMINPAIPQAQQRLALQLAIHLSSAESSTILAETAGRIPAWSDTELNDPISAGFMRQAESAIALTNRPEMAEVWGYAGDMLLKVINQVMSPQQAVLETSTLINEANGK